MNLAPLAALLLAQTTKAPARLGRRREGEPAASRRWSRWLGEPRNAVWFVLSAIVLLGGGRRVVQWWKARGVVDRLGDSDVPPETIRSAADHGRAAVFELFRLLGTAETEVQRNAAGSALAVIWKNDDLISEEEKALVRYGYVVTWGARRRYPRGLKAPIPITAAYGVPFLSEDGGGITPQNLEWSHRILGAKRADLETFQPWTPGPGRAEFTVIPGDFDTNGPHKLVLEAKARTAGLTEAWELALPHMPFSFEFDPKLSVEALLAFADSSRGETVARAVRLLPSETDAPVSYLHLNDAFALRNPPSLVVGTPLPCDLAHRVEIEIEGIPDRLPAGAIVVSGQGANTGEPPDARPFPLGLNHALAPEAIESPGRRRLRTILTPDPHPGWADPDVRSLWPESIVTEWVDVEVVRR